MPALNLCLHKNRRIRFVKGNWTAGRHVFNYKMRCRDCGRTWKEQQQTAEQAVVVYEAARKDDRALTDEEREQLKALRPTPCDLSLIKARRVAARVRARERQRRKNRSKKVRGPYKRRTNVGRKKENGSAQASV